MKTEAGRSVKGQTKFTARIGLAAIEGRTIRFVETLNHFTLAFGAGRRSRSGAGAGAGAEEGAI